MNYHKVDCTDDPSQRSCPLKRKALFTLMFHTHAYPSTKGIAVPDAVLCLDLASNDLTDYLTRICE